MKHYARVARVNSIPKTRIRRRAPIHRDGYRIGTSESEDHRHFTIALLLAANDDPAVLDFGTVNLANRSGGLLVSLQIVANIMFAKFLEELGR